MRGQQCCIRSGSDDPMFRKLVAEHDAWLSPGAVVLVLTMVTAYAHVYYVPWHSPQIKPANLKLLAAPYLQAICDRT